jgi:hypothetical protein
MRSIGLLLISIIVIFSAITIQPSASSSGSVEDSWVTMAPMHIARAWPGVAAVNGKVYAIGGSTASGFEPATFPYGIVTVDHFVGTNEEYDPTNNTWSYKAPMPTPRMCFAIAAVEGKIYCIGGRSGVGDTSVDTSVNEMYDPITDSWENKANMPIANGWIRAQVIDDKIYIVNIVNYGVLPESYYVYDPASDTWNSSAARTRAEKTLLDNIPDGYETTGIMSPKMIYTFSPSVSVYNPQNHSWQDGAGNPSGRSGFGVAIVNDVFYVVGGYTYELWGPFAPLATNERYVPIGYGTPDPSYVMEHSLPSVMLSPINKTEVDKDISLRFNVSKEASWVGYSLDGAANITIAGNTTLTILSSGSHNITVYANDTYGNMGTSGTLIFVVEEPFPLTLVVAASVVVGAVGVAAVIVFLKKHK